MISEIYRENGVAARNLRIQLVVGDDRGRGWKRQEAQFPKAERRGPASPANASMKKAHGGEPPWAWKAALMYCSRSPV